MFSADDYCEDLDPSFNYLGDDGRMRIAGKVRDEDRAEGFFTGLWEGDYDL